MRLSDLGTDYSQNLSKRYEQGGFPRVSTRTGFAVEGIGERPPETTTLKRLSETLQRPAHLTDPVAPGIPGGAFDLIVELERQGAEMKAQRAEEKEEAAEAAEMAASGEIDKQVIGAILAENPALVFEMLVEFLKSQRGGA